VEGVHGNDADILGQILLKGIDLGSFARGLAAHDGADLGSWTRISVHIHFIMAEAVQGANAFTTASMFFASTL
jgi:hypothetical protein